MSLLSNAMENCTILDKKTIPDGRGGVITTWEDGAQIKAAIALKSSMEVTIAQALSSSNQYFIITPKRVVLRLHDVIRRDSDGKIFRVKSDGDDMKTPESASLDARRVEAEEWSLNG